MIFQTNKLPIQLPTQPVPLVNGVTIKNEPQHVTTGSYIAIDPNTGLHYKVEVPNGQLTGDLGSDPLAAIMHETIFTETSAGSCSSGRVGLTLGSWSEGSLLSLIPRV